MSHHSLKVIAPAWYMGSLTVSAGACVILEEIAEACLAGRRVGLSQARWAELRHRTRRTISRQLKELRARGLIRVIRRGRTLTNLYRLARALWARLTGNLRPRLPRELQMSLFRLGLRIGVQPDRMTAMLGGP